MRRQPSFRLSLPPACARRRRALGPLACDILRARGEGRTLTAPAWLSLVLFGAFLLEHPAPLLTTVTVALFAGLCVISLFDAHYFVIPDGPLVFLGLFGVAACLTLAPQEIGARLAAAGLGFVALRFVAHAYETLRGAPGVGEGDARLFAVAGLWLGFTGLPSSLIYAVLSALAAAAVGLRVGSLENARAPIPFGPHIAFGLWLCWTIGPLEFG